MNELHLFAGAGGGILGGLLLGHRTVCAVEIDPYCRSVLVARQNDGSLPPFPILDDIRTFDGTRWRGAVDVVCGGFPCTDISLAGKGAGIDGEQSGLWLEMARVIREVRPRFVFVENSPALVARGLGRVLGDLAAMGFDAEWGVVSAADVGANHRRERIWIVAYADGDGLGAGRRSGLHSIGEARAVAAPGGKILADSCVQGLQASECDLLPRAQRDDEGRTTAECGWWRVEPDVGRVAHGVAFRVDRLKAIGNGQVPIVAATAWRLLADEQCS